MIKKLFAWLAIVAILIPSMPLEAKTKIEKQLEKQREKQYKSKMKEYKKEGWKVFGTSQSLEVALLSHYDALDKLGANGYELVGVASRFKSKNVGRQMALNNACTEYAAMAGSQLQGRIVSDLHGDVNNPEAEFDKFYAAYERLVAKEINGELRHSYSIIRDNGDGTFEMQSYYIVDQDAATAARMRAYENAMRESELAQQYAERVASFVREGFDAQ